MFLLGQRLLHNDFPLRAAPAILPPFPVRVPTVPEREGRQEAKSRGGQGGSGCGDQPVTMLEQGGMLEVVAEAAAEAASAVGQVEPGAAAMAAAARAAEPQSARGELARGVGRDEVGAEANGLAGNPPRGADADGLAREDEGTGHAVAREGDLESELDAERRPADRAGGWFDGGSGGSGGGGSASRGTRRKMQKSRGQNKRDGLNGEGHKSSMTDQGIDFRRIVKPLPNGRVRIVIEVRQQGRLAGRIQQVLGGWQFRGVGGERGAVWKTAAECKLEVAGEVAGRQ